MKYESSWTRPGEGFLKEGYASNDPKVKVLAKKFKKIIQKVRKNNNEDLMSKANKPLYDAVFDYLMTTEVSGRMKDPDFAYEEIENFVRDDSVFGLGKV